MSSNMTTSSGSILPQHSPPPQHEQQEEILVDADGLPIQSEEELMMVPLMDSNSPRSPANNTATDDDNAEPPPSIFRSRRQKHSSTGADYKYYKSNMSSGRRRRLRQASAEQAAAAAEEQQRRKSSWCCPAPFVRSTLNVMNFLARLLFWSTVISTVAAVFWYSSELIHNGTDPHLIAWFSAGAFVLLGFPISMYGIVMHLANYNQPNVQMYIVRILWMVPIYSMESWLCLRFHHLAIYIETLRDCYESYVLYSFLQFLIQVLGGEEQLVQMLKDKSPTRGVHMWGLQWCVKPWLMGQPISRTAATSSTNSASQRSKRIQWTSPFFVRCKFGVLQYVLLKFVLSVCVMILELAGLYKEGDFTPRGGYLYICILTNLSQCWALYCMIFFYYATKNELSPIRPVGKFLSVKAIVFFTWWQSVCISMIYQMDMIPHYNTSAGAVSQAPENEWTSEDVAKGLQDYLICIEMFIAAIVHTFVFPHTDYLPAAVAARQRAGQQASNKKIRLGRLHGKSTYGWLYDKSGLRDDLSKNSNMYEMSTQSSGGDLELASQDGSMTTTSQEQLQLPSPIPSLPTTPTNSLLGQGRISEDENEDADQTPGAAELLLPRIHDDDDSDENAVEEEQNPKKTGFVRALLDSTIPTDVIDQSVGIVKGDYVVEKKTLLHHASTSDQYDIFATRKFGKATPAKFDKGQD